MLNCELVYFWLEYLILYVWNSCIYRTTIHNSRKCRDTWLNPTLRAWPVIGPLAVIESLCNTKLCWLVHQIYCYIPVFPAGTQRRKSLFEGKRFQLACKGDLALFCKHQPFPHHLREFATSHAWHSSSLSWHFPHSSSQGQSRRNRRGSSHRVTPQTSSR